MSQKYEKLKTLLQELFQLDQPDLDFGLYRIMHAKSAEVSQFLDKDLLPQVRAAFGAYKTADKAEIEKELAKAVEQAQSLGVDPEAAQKVKDLRAKLASEAVDIGQLESEVYDHLFSFFRRYYSEGDFLAKRVYKPGVYAIPYEGEEVTLHWANKDQYYIKTSEYLRDYAFRLRPDDDNKPMRVHFRLSDAAEGEHGNVKAAEGKERRFKLLESGALAVEDGDLVVRFTYQPDTAKQKELTLAAESTILANTDAVLAEWIAALAALAPTAKEPKRTVLAKQLKAYSDRNTFDYFIHKDLGTFLRRELDFYIKNEVMNFDDVVNETAPRVEQYLSKIKVIRKIAGKIIALLAQLEDFQKKLWLKKKFVVETQWCIRVGCIPEALYAEIAANDAQRGEWVNLFAIDEIQGELATPGYSAPLKSGFLKGHPTLVVDTRYFDSDFTERLLEAIGDVDAQTDGVLFHSENFQALSLMQRRFRDQVKCIYIDPPYNKGGTEDFAYKDSYQHSSWLSMILSRLDASAPLLTQDGVLFASIDDNEADNLMRSVMMVGRFDGTKLIPAITNLKGNYDAEGFVATHEYVVTATVGPLSILGELPIGEDQIDEEWSTDAYGLWKQGDGLRRTGADAPRSRRPNGWFPVFIAAADDAVYVTASDQPQSPTDATLWPVSVDGEEFSWSWSKNKISREPYNLLVKGVPGTLSIYKKQRASLGDVPSRKPKSFLYSPDYSSTSGGNAVKALLGERAQRFTPKSVKLIADLFVLGGRADAKLLDYFAGSGTAGHAVINLNREDGGQRRFILVEMGGYFDTVLWPRIKKVTFTPEWKDGKPRRLATPEEAERSPRIVKVLRLESYDDALNNLETRRTDEQQRMLDTPQAQGADGLKEEYLLRYLLEVETRTSQSLLNVQAFTDPTAYKLKAKRPGSDESSEVNVDLLETFNWLIGLTVQHIAAPQTFSAAFERDSEKRLRLAAKRGGRLKQDAAGPYWFRTVTGTTPDGHKTLVIWRKLTGEPEEDNLVLDEWFTKQGYSARDSEFDLIYVNGGNNLENLKTPDDRWKVRLLEEDFDRLMFDTEGG